MNKYALIDKMCSSCGKYADIIIPNKVKLCEKCFDKIYKKGEKE